MMNAGIGIDFDNTIVCYDDLIHDVAVEKKLLDAQSPKQKKAMRDRIRALPDGEVEWQKIQAEVYGPKIANAFIFDGVKEFLHTCRLKNIAVYVVSHKTIYANYDRTRTNLRTAALHWMGRQDLLNQPLYGLPSEHIYFESTRTAKIQRINQLGLTHFIDDLEETFQEKVFPPSVTKILFDPHDLYAGKPDIIRFSNWRGIHDYFFRRKQPRPSRR